MPSPQLYSIDIKNLLYTHLTTSNATARATSPAFVGLSLCISRSLRSDWKAFPIASPEMKPKSFSVLSWIVSRNLRLDSPDLFLLARGDADFHGSKDFQLLYCSEQYENVNFERIITIKFFRALTHCRMINRDWPFRGNCRTVNQQMHTLCWNYNNALIRQLLHVSGLTGPSSGIAHLHKTIVSHVYHLQYLEELL